MNCKIEVPLVLDHPFEDKVVADKETSITLKPSQVEYLNGLLNHEIKQVRRHWQQLCTIERIYKRSETVLADMIGDRLSELEKIGYALNKTSAWK